MPQQHRSQLGIEERIEYRCSVDGGECLRGTTRIVVAGCGDDVVIGGVERRVVFPYLVDERVLGERREDDLGPLRPLVRQCVL